MSARLKPITPCWDTTILRALARGQSCIRCGKHDDTTVGCHYTGARRHAFGGGLGRKVHDLVMAHMCGECHVYMDQQSRDREKRWEHSEEFLFLVVQTILRLVEQGHIHVTREAVHP